MAPVTWKITVTVKDSDTLKLLNLAKYQLRLGYQPVKRSEFAPASNNVGNEAKFTPALNIGNYGLVTEITLTHDVATGGYRVTYKLLKEDDSKVPITRVASIAAGQVYEIKADGTHSEPRPADPVKEAWVPKNGFGFINAVTVAMKLSETNNQQTEYPFMFPGFGILTPKSGPPPVCPTEVYIWLESTTVPNIRHQTFELKANLDPAKLAVNVSLGVDGRLTLA